MARMKQKWTIGDVFMVRLKDDSVAVGQVVGREPEVLNSVTCAFFDYRATQIADVKVFQPASEHVIAVLFCTRDLLDSGDWKVVCSCDVTVPRERLPYEHLRLSGWVGARVTGSGIVISFLNAYHALEPWDDWKDPNYLDSLLISPQKKPKHLVLKKDKT